MPLKLTAIGEDLVREMLSRLHASGKLAHLACETGQRLSAAIGTVGNPTFVSNAGGISAEIGDQCYRGDGKHQVDVLAYDCHKRKPAIAFEVKLGTSLSANEFRLRNLKRCSVSKHQSPRINGSMVSILGRFGISSLSVTSVCKESIPISTEWWLVLRRRQWVRWGSSFKYQAGWTPPNVLVFDDIARVYSQGNCIGELVYDVIGKDFATQWELEP